jgi:hypothetical protein
MSATARLTGFRTYEMVAEVNNLSISYNLGEWDVLEADARREQMTEQYPFFAPMMAALSGMRSRAVRGLFEAPPFAADEAPAFDEDEAMAWVRLCEAFIAADGAAPARAVDRAVEACRLISVIGFGDDFPNVYAAACDVVLESGIADASADLLALGGGPRVAVPLALRGHRARLRGAAEARHGDDPVEAEHHLRKAIEHYAAWESPVYVARTQADLALALSRQGRTEEASAARAAARAEYERLGAAAWLLQLEQQRVQSL